MPDSIRVDSASLGVKRSLEAILDRFAACFEDLDDPGTGNAALRDFHTLLIIALCTVPCGGQGCVDMALFAKAKEPFPREFVDLKNRAPSNDTFSRLFRRLPACTGGSTGSPRAPPRQPLNEHSAPRGSPLSTTGTSLARGGRFWTPPDRPSAHQKGTF